MTRTLRLALLSPPFADLTYAQPAWLPEDAFAVGTRLLAPLGKTLRVAVRLPDAPQDRETNREFELKPALWPLERRPLADTRHLALVLALAARQLETPGRILASVMPQGLRVTRGAFSVYDGGKPRRFTPQQLARLDDSTKRELGRLWVSGNMEFHRAKPHQQEWASVTKDPPWPVRPAARRQMAVLEYLWEHGATPREVVRKTLGPESVPVLPTLAERGLVTLGPPPQSCEDPEADLCDDDASAVRYELTAAQRAAVEAFTAALDQALATGKGGAHLLYGVTGSGKTAVYLELARACLERGRSAMLLAPEVALAMNLRRAATAAFPDRRVLFHHGLQPPKVKEDNYLRAAAEGEPLVVVGARSALFLPLRDLGVVIMDEEHDASFKQDERLNYQAKEVAHFMAQQHGGLCVLGSATPDIKTFHAAATGALPRQDLTERFGPARMPEISLVDIRHRRATEALLADESAKRLREVVKAGEQAIVMLNRRGYAPTMFCRDCGQVAKCEHCDIGLTYHKQRERLVCHYCSHSLPYPLLCPTCGGHAFLPMGEGAERMEEHLATHLPRGTEVLRLDRDAVRRPGRMEEILTRFAAGEAQVLVGTQMLSKGHHFPRVTLVVAADGDMGLNLPDYRAAERSFQLLTQVAGRAGRGDLPGAVLIQTRNPDHYCWRYVQHNDYEGFFAQELERRQARRYPPFVKLGLARLEVPMDGGEVPLAWAEDARKLARTLGAAFMGPAPAPMPFLRGRRRYQCLIKAADWPTVRRLFLAFREQAGRAPGMRLSLDLDPMDML